MVANHLFFFTFPSKFKKINKKPAKNSCKLFISLIYIIIKKIIVKSSYTCNIFFQKWSLLKILFKKAFKVRFWLIINFPPDLIWYYIIHELILLSKVFSIINLQHPSSWINFCFPLFPIILIIKMSYIKKNMSVRSLCRWYIDHPITYMSLFCYYWIMIRKITSTYFNNYNLWK